jgi:hypothetical protein
MPGSGVIVMQCDEFEQLLGQQPGEFLPDAALAHLNACVVCRGLTADLAAIRAAALELGSSELVPAERVWVSLRRRLVAEGILRQPRPEPQPVHREWWLVFQRPALAGGFLALLVAAAGLFGYWHTTRLAGQPSLSAQVEPASVRSVQRVFRQETLDIVKQPIPQLPDQDPAVADSLRRNLNIVDNFIALCEKSVREQPGNEMAREYLYGAYEQKAELLNAAVTRDAMGGLQ